MNSQSSITYCDEYDSSDGFIDGTCMKNSDEKNRLKSKFLSVRNSLFSPVEENESKTSQTKMLSPGLLDKENLPPVSENENSFVESVWDLPVESKVRKKKPLRDLNATSQTQSQIQEESPQKKQTDSANQKKSRKSKKLWQGHIFDDNIVPEATVEKKAATRKSCFARESASPEYGQEPKMKVKHRKTIHETGVPHKNETSTKCEFSDAKICATVRRDATKPGFSPIVKGNRKNEKTWDKLSPIFPGAGSTTLDLECRSIKSSPDVATDSAFYNVDKNQGTAKGDDLKHLEMESIRNFSVEKFLKNIPDPWSYFGDRNRLCESYSDHSLYYLKMKFRKHYAQTLSDALMFHNYNLYLAYKYLMKKNRGVKLRSANRPLSECNANRPTTINEQFEQEVAFIENEAEVRNYVKNQKAARRQRVKEAFRQRTLKECERCFGAEFLPEEIVGCSKGHTFCKGCIIKHIETEVKNGKYEFDCLSQCDEKYSAEVIQDILKPEVFLKVSEISKLTNINAVADGDSVQGDFAAGSQY